jgi:hypothetical protein
MSTVLATLKQWESQEIFSNQRPFNITYQPLVAIGEFVAPSVHGEYPLTISSPEKRVSS